MTDTGRVPRRPHWWLAVVAGVVVVLGAGTLTGRLLAGGPAPSRSPSTSGGAPATVAPSAPGGRSNPALGVFRGTDPAAVDEYQQWLGRDVDLVVDFPTRDTWEQIAAPTALLAAWTGRAARQVQSVALLPEADASATMGRGAAGDYDPRFTRLATHLVAAGQDDAILRLGWEFNLDGSRWATDDPDQFVVYWRRVVAAMRAVPGQHFQFDWNPNNGTTRYDAVPYYPGDDVVDFIGVDAYDVAYTPGTYPYPAGCDQGCRLQRQQHAWRAAVYGGPRGLRFWSQFAAGHGKPLSLPEWGLWERPDGHGGGDDTYYLSRMADFIDDPANNVGYQAYFEYDGDDGAHRLMTTYPEAGVLFRKLFGSG